MSQANRNARQLQQMSRLLDLRQQRAEAAFLQASQQLQEIEDRKQGYSEKVRKLQAGLDDIAAFQNGVEGQSGVQGYKDAQVFRRWIIYDLEEAEFYFSQACNELAAQQDECTQLRQQWSRAREKCRLFADRRKQQLQLATHQAENSEELELEELNTFGARASAGGL